MLSILGGRVLGDIQRDMPISGLSILVDRAACAGQGRGIFFQQADAIEARDVNEMARSGRGVIAAALTADRAFALGLVPLGNGLLRADATRYVASVEAKACSETGISAAERALTLRVLGAPAALASDLVSPGHIMPAVVTEDEAGATSLVSLAFYHVVRSGGAHVVAWCDILDDEGEVATAAYCERVADRLAVPLYVRMGAEIVEAAALARSHDDPLISVRRGGLDLGQFA